MCFPAYVAQEDRVVDRTRPARGHRRCDWSACPRRACLGSARFRS